MARIMIVDDDEDFLKLATTYLKEKKHEVVTVRDGFECLEKLNEDPDLILLDIIMPEMDGWEALKKIKETKPDAKVAFLTVVDKKGVEEEEEAVDYIKKEKVSSKTDFVRRVQDILGKLLLGKQ